MNWQRVKEQCTLFGTFIHRTRETIDKDIVRAKEGEEIFPHEFKLAVIEEMRNQKAKILAQGLQTKYPYLPLKRIVEICREFLVETNWPKEYLVKRELTKRRKEMFLQRGY